MAELSPEPRSDSGAARTAAMDDQPQVNDGVDPLARHADEEERESEDELGPVEETLDPSSTSTVLQQPSLHHKQLRTKRKKKHGKQKYVELSEEQPGYSDEDDTDPTTESAKMMMAYTMPEGQLGHELAGKPSPADHYPVEELEMIEIHDVGYGDGHGHLYKEDDSDSFEEKAPGLTHPDGGILYEHDQALMGKGLAKRLLLRVWYTTRRQHWRYFLLHDALPPFVSYWSLWLFALGFWWGPALQRLAFVPLVAASFACINKTALVGRSTDWAYEGNEFIERLFGLTFPSVLFPLGLLLVHLKMLDVLDNASWPVVLIPFWTQYLLFLSFPAISLFFHMLFRRSLGSTAPFECSWFYLIKWPFLVPTIGFNMMLSVREDLPWAVAFLPICLALFSSLMSCFYMHLPNTVEVERYMASADDEDVAPIIDDEKAIV